MKNVSTLGKSDYEDNFYMHHIKLISPSLKAVGDPKSHLKGGQFGRPSDLQKLFVRSFCPLCKESWIRQSPLHELGGPIAGTKRDAA